MKKWPFVVLLVVGATILGATVLKEPIANAAQVVDANIIGPLDGQGNVKVHEQGTPTVLLNDSEDHPITVRDLDSPTRPFQREFEPTTTHLCEEYPVPADRRLVIEYVSGVYSVDPTLPAHIEVTTSAGGVSVHHIVPLTRVSFPTNGVDAPEFAAGEQVRIYANPDSTVQVCGVWNVEPTGFPGIVAISGHTVAVPTRAG